MGPKYRLVSYLAGIFTELGGRTALDALSGSGVLPAQSLGWRVTANDFLTFPSDCAWRGRHHVDGQVSRGEAGNHGVDDPEATIMQGWLERTTHYGCGWQPGHVCLCELGEAP